MSQTLTLPPAAPATRRSWVGDLLAGSAYLITGFPLALAAFVLLVTGTAVGLGTLVIVVGFAVLALTLAVARGFAALERSRVDLALGRRLPRPAYRPLRDGTVGGVLSAGADPRRWLDLVHGIVAFPVAVATFALTVAWWSAALGGTGYVLWEWALPRDNPEDTTLAELIGLGDGRGPDILLTTGMGLFALVTLPLVVRGCVAVQTGIARALLSGAES
jgi:hypothetical protein